MKQFAQDEIVVPRGPHKGRFRTSTLPWTELYFDAIDSGLFQRHAATGPGQAGKTLCCTTIPIVYHLFEVAEDVIFSAPILEICFDKYDKDIKPIIMASRYYDLMPQTGRGSRGGEADSITFNNGATLRFIPGGGSDKTRSSYTARVLVVTEIDGLDESSDLSREASPLDQLETRTNAYGDRKRVFLECTTSIEEGAIWQEIITGTDSKIVLPCPHCGEFVTPEREHFHGWEDRDDEFQAEDHAQFFCPLCSTGWSADQRRVANRRARLLHKGQSINSGGVIAGELPQTRTLGFRFSAVNNLFASERHLGNGEWKASREVDEENAKKARNQFIWAVPYIPSKRERTQLLIANIIRRQGPYERGVVPPDLQAITAGIDIGKYLLHYTIKAWSGLPIAYTVAYGVREVHSADLGEDIAILTALRGLRDELMSGLKHGETMRRPDCVLVDSGAWTKTVYTFIMESGPPFFASKGFGSSQYGQPHYNRPTATGSKVRFIGDGYHVSTVSEDGFRVDLVEPDVDTWKSRVHSRLECDPEKPGAILLFKSEDPRTHKDYARHLTAEKKVEQFIPEKGLQSKWVKVYEHNHHFDTEGLANVAGDFAGVQVVTPVFEPVDVVPPQPETRRFVRQIKFRRSEP